MGLWQITCEQFENQCRRSSLSLPCSQYKHIPVQLPNQTGFENEMHCSYPIIYSRQEEGKYELNFLFPLDSQFFFISPTRHIVYLFQQTALLNYPSLPLVDSSGVWVWHGPVPSRDILWHLVSLKPLFTHKSALGRVISVLSLVCLSIWCVLSDTVDYMALKMCVALCWDLQKHTDWAS